MTPVRRDILNTFLLGTQLWVGSQKPPTCDSILTFKRKFNQKKVASNRGKRNENILFYLFIRNSEAVEMKNTELEMTIISSLNSNDFNLDSPH